MKGLTLSCIILFILILFTGCSPSPETLEKMLEETISAIPTQTAYPTFTIVPSQTPYPTYTPEPTYVIIVTPTDTPTPLYTPTNTLIPTETPTPTNTIDPLTSLRGPGFYLVGVDIAPGIWRNDGTSDSCYWSVTTQTGDIIQNHFGMAGGTMYIPPNAFQVEMQSQCGNWVYLGSQ